MARESLPASPPPGSPWTPDQWEAIRSRDQSLLLAAAAGAGKTATLVERIIRRLTDPERPVEIDRLLVVTFTEAAAAEMRGRIAAALQKSLDQYPENGHLRRQMALLERAPISTLHSFCLSLLRQSFFQLQLDPAFTVMGEHEAGLMRQEVLDQVLEEAYGAEENQAFLALVDRYGGPLGDEGLRGLVLDLYDYARSTPWPEQWLVETVERFRAAAAGGPDAFALWTGPLLQDAAVRLRQASWRLREALFLARQPGGPAPYEEALQADLAAVESLAQRAEAADWEGVVAALGALAWPRLKSVRGGAADPELTERAKALRDEAKKAVAALQEDSALTRSLSEHGAELQALAPHMETLVNLVRRFDEAFTAAKAERAQVDFADLERYALQVLQDPAAPPGEIRPSPVARELRRRFVEVLVDEYQDINAVQDAILALVSRDGGEEGPPNRFMVGDVKQSIYRFRLAEPRLFLEKYRRFPTAPAAPERRIDLRANFRSRAGVIHGVNFLFRQVMSPGVGELAYDQAAELVAGARYPAPPPAAPAGEAPVECWFLEKPAVESSTPGPVLLPGAAEDEAGSGDEAGAEAEETTALAREARLVARQLRRWREEGLQVWDKEEGRYRPLLWRDVAILLRATRRAGQEVLDVLQEAGIPAYGEAGTGYFGSLEIETMLALLRVIDNPRQDIPLAAVLRAPFADLGLTPEELAQIRLYDRLGNFYDAVVRAAGATGTSPGQSNPPAESETGPAAAEAAATAERGPGPALVEAPAGADAPADSPPAPSARSQPEAVPGVAPALAGRLRAFLSRLDRWRTLARRQPLGQLLWQLYEETGYLYYVAGLPGGAQRRANLLALYDRARQFDQFARQGLFRFLRFVDRLREQGEDVGLAPALSESADVVRVMSIHKSKGLEFPVVFVLGLGRRFNRQDEAAPVLRHRDLGLGPAVVDPEGRFEYPSLAHRAIARRLHAEMLAEEMRILYVALTRARERLVLIGSVRDLPRAGTAWAAAAELEGWTLPDALLASAQSYLDWIGPALMRHPDAAPLRSLAVAAEPLATELQRDPSRWRIHLVSEPEAPDLAGTEPAATGAEALPATDARGGLPTDTESAVAATGPPGPSTTAGAAPDPSVEPGAAASPAAPAQVPGPRQEESAGPVPPAAIPWAAVLRQLPLAPPPPVSAQRRELAARLTWRYPHEWLTRLPAKETVTGVKHLFAAGARSPATGPDPGWGAAPDPEADARTGEAEEERLDPPPPPEYRIQPMARPRFLQEGRVLTPAERGTVTHLFLQHIRLREPMDRAALAEEAEELIRREILTPEQVEAIDLSAVAAFFGHELGKRLLANPERVRRELAFTYSLPAGALDPGIAGPDAREPVLLQGMIDCLLDEPHGLVLIDFKTDRLRPEQVPEAVARYSGQLILYARALAAIWRQPVAEAWLYFLAPGRAEPVPLPPALQEER